MESNQEQTLADIEKVFEDSKAARFINKNQWEATKGRLHMTLVSRREAGANLTIADMKAIEASAINDNEDVRDAYLSFIQADSKYRDAKVKWESAKRGYWDQKDSRR